MRTSLRALLAITLAVALTAALGAPVAQAAVTKIAKPAGYISPGAPLAEGPMTVQIGPGQEANQTIVIVGVTLDPSVKLPARIRLPLPKGAAVTWAGEVLGGDPSLDPEASATIVPGAGGASYAEFTLKQSHTGQIDTYAGPLTQNGASVSSSVTFVQSVPSTDTAFAVRIPPNTSNVQITPAPSGAPDTNSAGEKLYVISEGAVATGSSRTFNISYTLGAAPAAATASAQTPVYVLLGIVLVVVIIALSFVLQRASRAADDEAEDDEEYDGEDEEVGDEEYDEEEAESDDAEDDAGAEETEVEDASVFGDDPDDPFDSLDLE